VCVHFVFFVTERAPKMFRVCKALLFALSADLSIASRSYPKMDKAMSAPQVMERINALLKTRGLGTASALLQTRGLGTAKVSVDITPEAQESLNSALAKVVNEIEAKVESKIKAGHSGTQEAINKAIAELSAATTQAVDQKERADELDQAWFDCVTEEKGKRMAVEEAEQALAEARKSLVTEPAGYALAQVHAAQVTPCQLQEDRKMFTFTPDADRLKFVCDISEHGNCAPQLQNHRTQINSMMSGLRADAAAAVASWTEAKNACEAVKGDVAQKEKDLEDANKAWRAQRKRCLLAHESRQVSMCLFGKNLQHKCEKDSVYTDLIAEVEKVNGGEHSHPDRVQEWKTTSMTKCMLEKVISGANIDSDVLDACEAAVDYTSGVGDLDRKAEEYASLMAAHKFTCSESSIKFIGKTWNVPEGDAPASSDYTIESFEPAVALNPDAAPFGFCASGGSSLAEVAVEDNAAGEKKETVEVKEEPASLLEDKSTKKESGEQESAGDGNKTKKQIIGVFTIFGGVALSAAVWNMMGN